MDKKELNEQIDEVIRQLEELKDKVEYNSKESLFLGEVFNNIFYDKVPYMLRMQLIEMYNDYIHVETDDGDYYTFDFRKKKEFNAICNQIREYLGLEE